MLPVHLLFNNMAAVQGTLRKSDLFPSAILWLPKNADIADNITYRRSDLTEGALDHPALVVDTLGDNHDYLWICTVSCLTLQASEAIADGIIGDRHQQQKCWRLPSRLLICQRKYA